MLLSFSIENLYSFDDKAVLDLRATASKKDVDSIIQCGDEAVVAVGAICGDSASGKTNLLKSLDLFVQVVSGVDRWYFEQFAFAESVPEDRCSLVTMEFEAEAGVFKYEVAFKGSIIKVETLWVKGLSYLDDTYNLVFDRCYLEDKGWTLRVQDYTSTLVSEEMQAGVEYVHKMETKNNRLLLTSLMRWGGHFCFTCIEKWFDTVTLSEVDNLTLRHKQDGIYVSVKPNSEIYKLLSNEETKKEYVEFVKKLNPLVSDIELVEDKSSICWMGYEAFYVCLVYNGKRQFILNGHESLSTYKAIYMFPELYRVLKHGGLWIEDGLVNFIPSWIVADIVDMFKDLSINTGKGQILFTMTDTLVAINMSLRRDEIWFIDKDEFGKSRLQSIAKAYLHGEAEDLFEGN